MKKALIILITCLACMQSQATEFELSVNLAQQSGEYHNPYVVAWIENETGKSVRTLLLWREGAKWLKDLRTWWRKVGRKDQALVDGVTSATRAAGKYKVNLAADNDQGQPLAPGAYRLKLEVVRENGTRAMLTQAFSLNGTNQSFVLKATTETNQSSFTIKE